MSDPKYVIFNNSAGPITLRLYKEADLVEISKLSSHRRRRASREVFHTVVIQRNASKDLVAETGLPICELENNRELQSIIKNNKLKVILNSEAPAVEAPVVDPQPKVVEPVEPKFVVAILPGTEPEVAQEIMDILEEVVDPEELKKVILTENSEVEKLLLEEGNIFSLGKHELSTKVEEEEEDEKVETSAPKKRGRKAGKKGKH